MNIIINLVEVLEWFNPNIIDIYNLYFPWFKIGIIQAITFNSSDI